VKLVLASISAAKARAKSSASTALGAEYVTRAARYTSTEAKTFDSETALLAWLDRQSARAAPTLILCDSRGEQLTSEDLATRLGRLRDSGAQLAVLAIGPADGWSQAARDRSAFVLAFGRITLPHELAMVVLAEQVYRALTILAGHPYHSGH
jgi:23S rRNA (pseudouridine1915-N3)-methyltransferase